MLRWLPLLLVAGCAVPSKSDAGGFFSLHPDNPHYFLFHGKPVVLIADEPTGNLDRGLARDVMRLFRRFQEVGVTVVVATHDLSLVEEFGQRSIHIDDGKVSA